MTFNSVFDRILRKEIPADVVYEDDVVLAFRDTSPQAPTHVLVIPKKRAKTMNDLTEWSDSEVGALFRGAAQVAKQLDLADEGYRLVVNCGSLGMQTVPYIHIHLLGGRQLRWPPG